jgi:hypothetical protein
MALIEVPYVYPLTYMRRTRVGQDAKKDYENLAPLRLCVR